MIFSFTHILVSFEHSCIYQMISFMTIAFCDPFVKPSLFLLKLYCFYFSYSDLQVTCNWFFYDGKEWWSESFFFMWVFNWSSIIYYKRPHFPHCTAKSPLSYIKLMYMNGSATGPYSVPLIYFLSSVNITML